MSSYYDDASLMLLASGGAQKDGKVYSVKPTDGSGDFTFTRGSNLSATRVDASQLIEKGRENVLLQSQSFDNASWDKTRNVVTANTTTAPDGTNTADKIAANATFSTNTSRVKQDISVSGLNTISLYAKADEITEMLLFELGNNNGIYFNLTSGSFVSYLNGTTNIIDYNIEDAGNDWYRYSITYSSSITRYAVYLSKSGSYVTDFTIGEGFYVWGGQIEQGLVATPYIETGATSAQAGILENTPRFDYSGGATCPSLLLEPSRTNQMRYSEYQSGGGFALGANITWNGFVESPEGVNNASRFTSSATSASFIQASNIVIPSGDFTYSMWVRGISGSFISRPLYIPSATIGGVYMNEAPVAGEDWKLVYGTGNNSGSAITYTITLPFYDQPAGSVFEVYGFQLEAGSYPTSYIPTYGVSQTRASDYMPTNYVSSFMSGNSYTFLIDVDLNSIPNNVVFNSINNSVGSYSFSLRNYNGALRVYNNMDTTYPLGAISSDTNKWVIRIDGTSYTIFSNNGGTPTKTTGTSLVTQRNFGSLRFDSPTEYKLKQFLLFPTALSDLDCKILIGATTYNTFAAMALALNYTVYE